MKKPEPYMMATYRELKKYRERSEAAHLARLQSSRTTPAVIVCTCIVLAGALIFGALVFQYAINH